MEKKNVLCIAGALFGRPFIQEAHRLGWNVHLLTEERYLNEAWERDYLADVYAVKDLYDERVVKNVVNYLSRNIKFDRIVGLGEFDIEVAAAIRENTRIAGMGETTARYFRDKLAMRMKAREEGIKVPDFVRILHHPEVKEFMERIPAPWIFKPRMGASSAKVKKIYHPDEFWTEIEALGDKQNAYLLEEFIAGDVYHVDSIVYDYKVPFASISKYGMPMLDLNTTGGIFTTRQIKRGSPDEKALKTMNAKLIKGLGLKKGATHIEYIKGKEDGEFYFLEAGARVGGARIPDVIWHATGVCQWHEWARLELSDDGKYKPSKAADMYGGGIFTLAKQDHPDMSAYNDPEVCWVQNKKNYAGLIIKSSDPDRVEELLMNYYPRFAQDFMAHVPAAQP
ncbi:MAG: ATP-grasp domain-containing protein [Candidatus Kapabacteria bacterium]|nr:ATP-grasp domain-containing protein [Candidatus Kapabacteria bacterium]